MCCRRAGLCTFDSSKNLFMLPFTRTANNYAKVGLLKLLPVSCCEVLVDNCTITFLGNNANKYQAAIGCYHIWILMQGVFGSLSEMLKGSEAATHSQDRWGIRSNSWDAHSKAGCCRGMLCCQPQAKLQCQLMKVVSSWKDVLWYCMQKVLIML